MSSDRFERLLPLSGVLAGLLFLVAFIIDRNDPGSERGPATTLSYWQDNRGLHQVVAILILPLVAFLLLFFGAGLKRRLERSGGDSGYASVAFGGVLMAAAGFAVVGMLEAAMTNAAHDGERQAVYTLNQFHSYDWLAWNPACAAVLLATGLGVRRNGMLPTAIAWATIVIGASLVTPLGFFGFVLVPVWLIVVGLWLARGEVTTSTPADSELTPGEAAAA